MLERSITSPASRPVDLLNTYARGGCVARRRPGLRRRRCGGPRAGGTSATLGKGVPSGRRPRVYLSLPYEPNGVVRGAFLVPRDRPGGFPLVEARASWGRGLRSVGPVWCAFEAAAGPPEASRAPRWQSVRLDCAHRPASRMRVPPRAHPRHVTFGPRLEACAAGSVAHTVLVVRSAGLDSADVPRTC